jgi:thiamine biosynthesis lipoprotein
MATTFEIVSVHPDVRYAEQAAWAAFELLDRLEQELSRYVENSDISRINSLAADQPVLVGLACLECLEISARIHAETDGAFDVTAGRLVDFWRDRDSIAQSSDENRFGVPPLGGFLKSPTKVGTTNHAFHSSLGGKTRNDGSLEEDLRHARRQTGMHLIELDKTSHTVRLRTCGVRIDLGGIGKGYAVDRMARLLLDWGIEDALIHGGRSTALAFGKPARQEGWPVSLMHPDSGETVSRPINLCDRAISGSGLQKGLHIVDPRTGRLAVNRRAAWSSAPTATLADALSTAFMVMTPEEIERYCANHPDVTAVVTRDAGGREANEVQIQLYGCDL